MSFSIDTLTLATSTLREAQSGALYAIAAHRSTSDEPAQVVLPTGVGKTLVAVLTPYLLEARRVLVVTPARIVRDQVAHEFSTLGQVVRPGLTRATRCYARSPTRVEFVRGDRRS